MRASWMRSFADWTAVWRAVAANTAKEDMHSDTTKYNESLEQVDAPNLARCLVKASDIQWDYKNIVRLKGKL